MSFSMSVLSTQYVIVPVTTLPPAGPDPRQDTVQFAFKLVGTEPAPADWVTGSWIQGSAFQGQYLARVLVGPGAGGLVLAIGAYAIWLKVTDNPEVPVLQGGVLTVTQ